MSYQRDFSKSPAIPLLKILQSLPIVVIKITITLKKKSSVDLGALYIISFTIALTILFFKKKPMRKLNLREVR